MIEISMTSPLLWLVFLKMQLTMISDRKFFHGLAASRPLFLLEKCCLFKRLHVGDR